MNIRKRIISMMVSLILLALAVTAGVASQSVVTPIPQETLDAAVQSLFQATADAIERQTATAQAVAPTQTIEALFQQALTATAQMIIPAYDRYQVTDVQAFDLMAGPGNTAAHLAPDGSKFIHAQGFTICLYERVSNNNWSQTECQDVQTRESGSEDWGEMRWSPDGRRLSLSTYRDLLLYFRDSDIRVLDMQDFSTANLTDDEITSNLLSPGERGNYDLSALWLNEAELIFLRYTPKDDDSAFALNGPHFMRADMSGNVTQITSIPASETLSVYTLALAPDGSQVAYGVDYRDRAAGQGLWSMNMDDLSRSQIVEMTLADGLPINLEYSADSRYLLLVNALDPLQSSTAAVVDIASGTLIEIDPERRVIAAAWSPAGSALLYLVRNPEAPQDNGLYITAQPGAAGRLLLQGDYIPPTCCTLPLVWGKNDTILLSHLGDGEVLAVRVGP